MVAEVDVVAAVAVMVGVGEEFVVIFVVVIVVNVVEVVRAVVMDAL